MYRVLSFLPVLLAFSATAQSDSTRTAHADTVYTPKWIITIQRNLGRPGKDTSNYHTQVQESKSDSKKKKRSYGGGFDFGWSNYIDNTDYNYAHMLGQVDLGVLADDMKLKLGSSRNVNIWFLMDETPLIKKTLQLQYGFGVELNNYFLDAQNVYFGKNPTYVYASMTQYKKAKLAADYLSVPLMLKLNLTPNRKNFPFTIAGGVSGGFLYSARFKTKNSGDITKIRSDFDLERFKFSYVGELGLGPIKLYGSYAMKDMFRNSLNMTPYTVGFRFVD